MRHEIIKKTIVYRLIAFTIGLLIPILMTGSIMLGIISGLVCETISLITYYLYELSWNKAFHRLKKGSRIMLIDDKYSWYNVVEELDENKFIIEVC